VFAQIVTFRFTGLLTRILFFLGIAAYICGAQEASDEDATLGELKLEGKYIDRLVLQRKDGRTERLDRPAETIKLPVGEYRLLEAHLNGAYTYRSNRPAIGAWVTITKDEAAVLKVGAPLKQTVKVQRQGMILVLKYELLGVGGKTYTAEDRDKPPTFAIYRGEEEIASGQFEFG